MIINSISLKNFISHANTNIDFPMGVSLIVGPNGAGKSAVIDGILYALLGEKVRGDSIDDLIREGNSEAEVSLNFQLDGLNYNIRRSRQKSMSPTAILQVNQKMIARSHSAVTRELLKFLSLDKETIMNSIFIRQGEIAGLIDADPAKRKEIIGKLIGLDRLEKAYKNMRKLIRHFEEESQQFIGVKKELDIRNENVENLVDDIKKEKSEIKQISETIKVTAKEAEIAKKEFEVWKTKEENFNEISKQISILIERLKAKNEKIDELEKNKKEAESAKKQMEIIEPKIKNIESLENYIKILTQKNSFEENLKSYKKELEKVSNLTSELNENQEFYREYIDKNEDLVKFRKQLEQSQKEEGKYIEIATNITNIEHKIEELISEIAKIEEKALKILDSASIETRDKYIQELDDDILNLESNISKLQDEIGNIKGRLNDIDEYIQILGDENECPVCHTKLTDDHRHEVYQNFTTEKESKSVILIENRNRVKELEKKRKELKIQLDQCKELQIDNLEQNNNKLIDLTPNLESLKAQLKEKEKIVEEITSLKSNINKHEKEIEQLRNNYNKYIAAERSLKQERAIGIIKSDIHEANKQLREVNNILSSIITKLEKIPEDPDNELKLLRELNKKYEVLKSKSQDLIKFNEQLIDNKSELENIKLNKTSLDKELNELHYDKNLHEQVQNTYNEVSKTLSQLEKTKELKIESVNKKDEDSSTILEIINKLTAKLKDLEKITGLLKTLNDIRGAFSKDGIQKFIRKKIAPIITEITREYLDYFNLDITDISINEDFDILIYGRSGEISIKSISGGEKVAVAIALRLAIAKTISGRISTIIMDEPTTHLDEERRRELVKIMNNFLRETSSLPQMIIVTHHQELEDLADTIYRVKKIDDVSKVKEI